MCDGCGKILRGIRGTVPIKEANLAIRGQITMFDEDGTFTHITHHAQEDMCFCDSQCFKDFCNQRIEVAEKKRKHALMREASDNIVYGEA